MPHGSFFTGSSESELALPWLVAGRLHGLFHAALSFVAAAVAPGEEDGGELAFVSTAPQARLPAHLPEGAAFEDRGDGLRIIRKAAEAQTDGADREDLRGDFLLRPGSRAREQVGEALQLDERQLRELVLVPKLALHVADERLEKVRGHGQRRLISALMRSIWPMSESTGPFAARS